MDTNMLGALNGENRMLVCTKHWTHIAIQKHTDQLLTCINVKFVCAAICRFSSSVGYGCCI